MTSQNPSYILAVVCSAMFLDIANLSAITIALPTVQKEFGVPVGNLQWVISAYALTFGSFLLLGGRGSDMLGHRRILLFGMCFFALFTLVCALAPTFIGLVIARAFQGIGAAFTIPAAQAHIALHFQTPAKKASALGFWGASGSLGFILGLILGGILTDLIGWRWIFWVSLIISGIVIPAALFTLPRPATTRRASSPIAMDTEGSPRNAPPAKKLVQSILEGLIRFDALGVLLGIPGILILTYALTSANSVGRGKAQIIITIIVAAFLLALFVLHERGASQAILAPHLFRSASFDLTLVLAVNTYAVRQACTYFLTVELQSFGNSPIHTSVLFIPLGVSALISNTIAGRLVPIFGARVMFILGWGLSIPGVLLFSYIDKDTSYWRFTFPGMILYISGIGTAYITANFVVVSLASKSDQGAAAGVFNVALQVGGSVLGLAVLTAIAQAMEENCLILCAIGFLISVFAIRVPKRMRGSFWGLTAEESNTESTVPGTVAEEIELTDRERHFTDVSTTPE